jgi:hypothetical protein
MRARRHPAPLALSPVWRHFLETGRLLDVPGPDSVDIYREMHPDSAQPMARALWAQWGAVIRHDWMAAGRRGRPWAARFDRETVPGRNGARGAKR